MTQIVLTKELANAASLDAGNASMRRAGRTKWSVDDYNSACKEQNRLYDLVEG